MDKKLLASNLSKIYGTTDLVKSAENQLNQGDTIDIQKGKIVAPNGTIKEFGGRSYIKTTDGWKYHGKGGGAKAKEHSASTGGGHPVGEGSRISAKDTVGTVTKTDDTHHHVEWTDKKGKKQTTKVEHADMDKKIADGDFEHHVPASKVSEMRASVTGATPAKGALPSEKVATDQKVDMAKRWQAYALYTKAVIAGKMKSLIAYGTGGVGKTYTVTKELEAAGKKSFDENKMNAGDEDYDYVKITGKSTPAAVYKELYQHNGKILLFDDNDKVLQEEDAVNFFKGALDTSGDGTISYGTTKKLTDDEGNDLPKRFKFTGRVIFISNLPADKIPQPLKSRGFRVDLTMDEQSTMDRIRDIAADKSGKYTNLKFPGIDAYTHEDMDAVIKYLDKHKHDTSDLNVRTVGAVLGIKQMAEEVGEKDWEGMADQQIFSKSESINIQAVQKARILKSYGVDFKKAIIAKSEDVKSNEYKQEVEERADIETGAKSEIKKALETLGLEDDNWG